MKAGESRPVVVAAGQIQSRLMNDAAATLEALDRTIAEAARQQVELLVLPECAYPAYLLGSVASYRAGGHLSSQAFVDWLARQAKARQLHIVSGFVEDAGTELFNAAVLIGPDGEVIGRTRKRFLWHVDHDWFAPGNEIEAFDTALGRVGIIICAEARVPEIIATLAADGAELIAMPTCWINCSRQPGEYYNPQPDYLIEARAREFGLPFICADKSGLELTTGYVGQSCVAFADGSIPVRAPSVGESLIVTSVTPARARPTWIAEQRRARLLDAGAPVLPARDLSRKVTLAAASTAMVESRGTNGMGEALFEPLRIQGVKLLAANIPAESTAERLGMLANAFDMAAVCFPSRTDVFAAGPARVGCMAGERLQTFASARALVLEGAEVLVYFDADDRTMLRTRALENRGFVIGTSASGSVIVGPDGNVLACGCAERPAIATVDLADAGDKYVAPKTDIFAERRVGMYRL